MVKPHHLPLPDVLEIKTGAFPTFTPNQSIVYPMTALGRHVFSPSPRISTFGFAANQTLPSLNVIVVYAPGPGEEFQMYNIEPEFR